MKQAITRAKCPDCSVGNEEYCVRIHKGEEIKGMKQNILKEQWYALDVGNKYDLAIFFDGIELANPNVLMILTIGDLIEFLGDDLIEITRNIIHDGSICGYNVFVKDTPPLKPESFYGLELVDALWEAVKYKLKLYGN